MEEKNKKMKVVSKKDAAQDPTPTQEKLTYEQLEGIANNLNNQCRELYEKLKEAQRVIDNFNIVGMLLSVLGKSEYYSEPFVQRCSDKIEEMVGAVIDQMDLNSKEEE